MTTRPIRVFDGANWVNVGVQAPDMSGYVTTSDSRLTDERVPVDGSVTDAKLAVPKVDQSVVGNLLTANQASVETDTTGLGGGGSATVARSTAEAYVGTSSLEATVGQVSHNPYAGTPRSSISPFRVLVTPGVTYTAHAAVKSAIRTLRLRILWWTAAGVNLGDTGGTGVVATSWTPLIATGVAPATAAYASVEVDVRNSGSIGDTFYVDALGIWQGAGGLWSPPGTPIANLGTYTDESVGRRIFTWDAVNARWQMTYGDTGWRNVIASAYTTVDDGGTNAITWTRYALRRVNQEVHVVMQFSVASALSTTSTSDFAASSFAGFDSLTFNGEAYLPVYSNVNLNQPVGRVNGSGFTGRVSGTTFVVNGTYTTTQAWPTSLPGTAVGSIPS